MSWKKYFTTTPKTPHRLFVPGSGVVDFSKKEIDHKVLLDIYERGLPYLELTTAGKEKFYGIKEKKATQTTKKKTTKKQKTEAVIDLTDLV